MAIQKKSIVKSVAFGVALVAPAAFAAGEIDISAGLAYVTGALAAVAGLGMAYLGLDNLKKVWSKITSTRV